MSNETSPVSSEPELPSGEIAQRLEEAWAALDDLGARVSRVPLDWPPSLLEAKLRHEQRRLRALWER